MTAYSLDQAQRDIADLRGQIAHLLSNLEVLNLITDTQFTAPDGSVWTTSGLAMAAGKYITIDTWHSMSLAISGWTDNSGSSRGCRVRLLPNKRVALDININIASGSTTTDGSTIATLPSSSYYPAMAVGIPVTAAKNSASGAQTPHLDITTAGAIRCWGISSGQSIFASHTYSID